MALERIELERRLASLESQLPALVRQHPNADDFYAAFAGLADEIADAAGPSDFDWVEAQIDELLSTHGAP